MSLFNIAIPLSALRSTRMVWSCGSAKNFRICSTALFSSRAVSSAAGTSPPSSRSSGINFRMCFCKTDVSATVWTADTSMVPAFSSVPPPSDMPCCGNQQPGSGRVFTKKLGPTMTGWMWRTPSWSDRHWLRLSKRRNWPHLLPQWILVVVVQGG